MPLHFDNQVVTILMYLWYTRLGRQLVAAGLFLWSIMATILQLNPPLPLLFEGRKGMAYFMLDEGIEHDTMFLMGMDDDRTLYWRRHKDLRLQENITLGRLPEKDHGRGIQEGAGSDREEGRGEQGCRWSDLGKLKSEGQSSG